MHHIKLFFQDGEMQYIHHDTNHLSDPEPGAHLRRPHGEQVRFFSRDGDFTITFKTEWPFDSPAPGDLTISGTVNHWTPTEVLKDISPRQRKAFPYTAQIVGHPPDDPEIIIDEGAGGDGPKAKKKKKKK